ncbi:MAG TPA: molybdopterin molybdotransferase MoeA [Symbiobacteriaceae bacterium]|nr:molybdopterin molybdotransferase MoeA [Symbiobacteriaceae bacterium]
MQQIQPLDLLTVTAARQRFDAALDRVGWAPKPEAVPVSVALGRVTAAPVHARRPVPHYPAAAVDGVAVRSGNSSGALRLCTEVYPVNTGHPVPTPFDTVVMKEELRWSPDGSLVYVDRPVQAGKHIRAIGSDAAEGQFLLPAGHRLRPVDLGALLSVGVTEVPVWRQPRVGFLPTGSELVEPGESHLRPGQVVESNSAMVLGEVTGWGGMPLRHPIVADDRCALRCAIKTLLDQVDLLLIGGGSSQGTEDHTVHLLREMGVVLVHGVAMRPGKPVILALVEGKPVIGLPGYPGASWLAARLFARPLLNRFQRQPLPEPERVTARLGAPVKSPRGLAHYLRVRLEPAPAEARPTAHPFPASTGSIGALISADGLALIPPEVTELPAGALIDVERI